MACRSRPFSVLTASLAQTSSGEQQAVQNAWQNGDRLHLWFQRTGEQKALRASFTQSWGLTRACIEALDEIGGEYVVAPREADSQKTQMAYYAYHNGEADYIYADDADFSVMGCKLIKVQLLCMILRS